MDLIDRLLDMVSGDDDPPYVLDTWGNTIEDPVEIAEAVSLLARSLARPANTGDARITAYAIGCTEEMARDTRRLAIQLAQLNRVYGFDPPLRLDEFSLVLGRSAPDDPDDPNGSDAFKFWGAKLAMQNRTTDLWFGDEAAAVAAGRPYRERFLDGNRLALAIRDLDSTDLVINRNRQSLARWLAQKVPLSVVGKTSRETKTPTEILARYSEVANRKRSELNANGGRFSYPGADISSENPSISLNEVRDVAIRYGGESLKNLWDLADIDPSLGNLEWASKSANAGDVGRAVASMMNGDPTSLTRLLEPVARRLLNGSARFGIRFTPDMQEVEFGPDAMDWLVETASPVRVRWITYYPRWMPWAGYPPLDIVNLVEPDAEDYYGGPTILAFSKPILALRDKYQQLVRMREALPAWWSSNNYFEDDQDIYSAGGRTEWTRLFDAIVGHTRTGAPQNTPLYPVEYDLLNNEWTKVGLNY